jgi:hypothetical protein
MIQSLETFNNRYFALIDVTDQMPRFNQMIASPEENGGCSFLIA